MKFESNKRQILTILSLMYQFAFLFTVKRFLKGLLGPSGRKIKNLEAGFGRHLRTFEATFGQKIKNTEAQE